MAQSAGEVDEPVEVEVVDVADEEDECDYARSMPPLKIR